MSFDEQTNKQYTKQEIFDIVKDALIDHGFAVLGGGDTMLIFKEPYTKLFFNMHGDLVLRGLENWEEQES